MKRKPKETSNGKATEGVPDVLAAYGERFMSMFDDYDEQAAKRPRHSTQQQQSSSSKPSTDDDSEPSSLSEPEDNQAKGSKAKPKTNKQATAAAESVKAPASKVDAFLSKKKGVSSSGAAAAAAQTKARVQAQQKQQEQQRLIERKLKKQFLSSKVSKIFSDVDHSQLTAGAADKEDADELTAEEFAKMKRDVELLGASALDKRSAKAWKASMLARLGASAGKAPRTAAKIGHGMAKKAKQREAVALQEAIATGMVQAKGRGKKARALKAKQRDKGLMEAGPGFKNGVLRLKKSMFKPNT